jgi:hypothetical protein
VSNVVVSRCLYGRSATEEEQSRGCCKPVPK